MSDAVTPIEIDCLSVKQQLDAQVPFKFLDCREQDEYDRVKNSPLIIHCHHGGRSLRVARWLRGQGFVHAQSMAGGIDQWAQHIDTSLPRY
jgi:rhodanese-related sulfurtransferase